MDATWRGFPQAEGNSCYGNYDNKYDESDHAGTKMIKSQVAETGPGTA